MMKRDLRIAGFLIGLAALGIGVVVSLPFLQKEDDAPKTIKPKTEPIVQIPKKPTGPDKKLPIKLAVNEKKQPEPKTVSDKKEDPNTTEPGSKIEPSPKKIERKDADKKPTGVKVIAFGNLVKLNDPDGDHAVKAMQNRADKIYIGRIKTLTIADINDHSVLDLSNLEADEIIFIGNINGGSKVKLGKAQLLKVGEVNDKSELDGSALEAAKIVLNGAVNSGSTVKLHAPGGTIMFAGAINDRSVIEVAAPDGKVIFKSPESSVINGDAKLTITAKEVDLRGDINGNETQLDITLTKNGYLAFRRLNGSVRLMYRKADAADPPPRIDEGVVDARAQFRLMPAARQ